MSCVAELKAISQKKASVHCRAWGAGMENATPASDAPTMSSIATTHHRFVRIRSTTGLQKGLMTQGR